MTILKSFISAISLYSRIPMPNLEYKEGEDRFSLCFFPVVGVVIAGLQYIAYLLYVSLANYIALVIIFSLIPVIVTGGIHIDGYMDTCDALHSYGDVQKRMAILSDPHIGAFAVIKLLELTGIWMVGVFVTDTEMFLCLSLGFIVSRAMSGLNLLTLKAAKDTGMLAFTKSHASKRVCVVVLSLWIAVVFVYAVLHYGIWLLIPELLLVAFFAYYRCKIYKEFNGVTGDTSGWFLVVVETIWVLGTAAASMV